METSPSQSSWSRVLRAWLVLPLASVLTAGTCYYHSYDCHHHHDDCHDHHHDHHHAKLSEDLVLREFRSELSDVTRAHPLQRVYRIAGIGLDGPIETDRFDEPELEDFTRRVYQANRSLIGLPPQAGRLVFEAVTVGSETRRETIEVRWLQVAHDEPSPGRAAGHMTFVLNPLGELEEIRNETWLR